MIVMSNIYVSSETKRELIKISGELQAMWGRRVDFDDVIRFLIRCYRSRQKNKELFKLFASPIPNVSFDECYRELIEERRRELR